MLRRVGLSSLLVLLLLCGLFLPQAADAPTFAPPMEMNGFEPNWLMETVRQQKKQDKGTPTETVAEPEVHLKIFASLTVTPLNGTRASSMQGVRAASTGWRPP